MGRKYFGWEQVLEFIWQQCDKYGICNGDAKTLAGKFHVMEDEAHEVLGALSHRRLIESLVPGTYAIMRWRERDEAGEEEQCSR